MEEGSAYMALSLCVATLVVQFHSLHSGIGGVAVICSPAMVTSGGGLTGVEWP